MKKLLILIFSLFFFSSSSVYAEGSIDTLIKIGKGDAEIGLEHMRKLADEGNSSALFFLGNLSFELGNPKESELLLNQASELNHPVAMKFLATGYFKGLLGDTDYKKAAYWFEKASLYGNINSMVYLGVIYRDGLGIDPSVPYRKNLKTSYMWFTIAGILKEESPGDKEPEEFAKEVATYLSKSEIDDANNLANKWINDTLIRDVTIPSIPGPEDFNN
ncbi:MAG: sel1 repeat family protein [Thiotrichales bacterium]|nr:sel1 repeat family protein [Thiotrichales bacterium]